MSLPLTTRFGADPLLDLEIANKRYVDNSIQSLTFAKVVKSADESISDDTVLHDDLELKFNANANKSYFIFLCTLMDSHTTPDMKYAWSIPSGALMLTGVSSSILFREEAISTFTRAGTDTIVVGTGNNEVSTCWMYRLITDSTPGEAVLQWAQNNTSPLTTIMLRGSLLLVWEE